MGFVGHFDAGRMTVAEVLAESPAARAGLEIGDRITRANGQVIAGRLDWQRACVHIDPSRPLDLVRERAGIASAVSMPLTAGLRESVVRRPPPGSARVSLRAAGHARARHPGLRTTRLAAIRPSRRLAARLDRHGLDRAAHAPGGVLARAATHPAGADLDPVRRQRCGGAVAVRLLRGVPPAHLVACPTRRGDDPGRCSRLLARLQRLPGIEPAGSRDDGAGPAACDSPSQHRLRRGRHPHARGARPDDRDTDGPPPYPRARRRNGHRRHRRRRRRGRILAPGRRRHLRHAHARGALARVSRCAGLVRVRHPAASAVRSAIDRAPGRAVCAGPPAARRADSGTRRAAARRSRADQPPRTAGCHAAVAMVVVHARGRSTHPRAVASRAMAENARPPLLPRAVPMPSASCETSHSRSALPGASMPSRLRWRSNSIRRCTRSSWTCWSMSR